MIKMGKTLLLSAFVFSLGAGCGGKPSKGDCEKAVTHVMDVLVKELGGGAEGMADEMKKSMEKEKPKMLEECQKKSSKKEIDCMLAAKSMADLEKCDSKDTK